MKDSLLLTDPARLGVRRPPVGRVVGDLLVVALPVAAVAVVSLHAMDAAGVVPNGVRPAFPVPPLHGWLEGFALRLWPGAPAVAAGAPSALATLLTAWLIYGLGRRWLDRPAALLAGGFWALTLYLGRLSWLAGADMLLTMWTALALWCADQLLFHPMPGRWRLAWALGLWAALGLGGLTRGWGVPGLVLVGVTVSISTALWPGLRGLAGRRDFCEQLAVVGRMVARRSRRAMRGTYFAWGLLAMLLALVPTAVAAWLRAGPPDSLPPELQLRGMLLGLGPLVEGQARPGALWLLYLSWPVFTTGLMALWLTPLGRWVGRRGRLLRPLAWLAGSGVLALLAEGPSLAARLNALAALALLAGGAIEELSRRQEDGAPSPQLLRHALAAGTIATGLAVALAAAGGLVRPALHENLAALYRPDPLGRYDGWVAGGLIALGLLAASLAVTLSLRRRIRPLAIVLLLAMLGAIYVDTHLLTLPPQAPAPAGPATLPAGPAPPTPATAPVEAAPDLPI